MFSVALSGLAVAQKELAVTSNNLANASTTGFKRSDASFADVFANDPTTTSKTQVGLGSRNDAVSRSEGQGAMSSTQRVTDLAISGRGFFVIKPTSDDLTVAGSALLYTRSGNFSIDRKGFVVNNDGAQLQAYATQADAVSRTLTSIQVPQEKNEPAVQVSFATSDPLNANFAKPNVGDVVTLYANGVTKGTATLTAADITNGYVSIAKTDLTPTSMGLSAKIVGVAGKVSPASAKVLQEQTVKVSLTAPNGATLPAGGIVTVYDGTTKVGTATVKAGDVANGFVLFDKLTLSPDGSKNLTASLATAKVVSAPQLRSTVNVPWTLANAPAIGDVITVSNGATVLGTATITSTDLSSGSVDIQTNLLNDRNATLTATSSASATVYAATEVAYPIQPGTVRTSLLSTGADRPLVNDTLRIFDGTTQVGSILLTDSDIARGYVDVGCPLLGAEGAKTLTGTVSGKSLALTSNIIRQPTLTMALTSTPPNSAVAGETINIFKAGALVGSKVLTAADIQAGSVTLPVTPFGTDDPTQLTASIGTDRTDPITPTGTPSVSSDVNLIAMAAEVKVTLPNIVPKPAVNDVINIYNTDKLVVGTAVLTAADLQNGYVNIVTSMASPLADSAITANMTAIGTPMADATDVTVTNPQLQSLAIDKNGVIGVTYSDNTTVTVGYVAIANFASEGGLKAIGNSNFAVTLDSGAATITRAGPPSAGTIMSGTLEEANVNITTELTNMLRAQQVYNANARMLQTQVDTISRITDKL